MTSQSINAAPLSPELLSTIEYLYNRYQAHVDDRDWEEPTPNTFVTADQVNVIPRNPHTKTLVHSFMVTVADALPVVITLSLADASIDIGTVKYWERHSTMLTELQLSIQAVLSRIKPMVTAFWAVTDDDMMGNPDTAATYANTPVGYTGTGSHLNAGCQAYQHYDYLNNARADLEEADKMLNGHVTAIEGYGNDISSKPLVLCGSRNGSHNPEPHATVLAFISTPYVKVG